MIFNSKKKIKISTKSGVLNPWHLPPVHFHGSVVDPSSYKFVYGKAPPDGDSS